VWGKHLSHHYSSRRISPIHFMSAAIWPKHQLMF
jgi:hypothetical protein